MNKIILAYAPENAPLALQIEQALSRIGIPFEPVSTGLAQRLSVADAPVLLLVTDNLLTHFDSMLDLLPALQSLMDQRMLTAVLADGVDQHGQVVETHIDRMANALHYMKHWQDVWLEMSDRHAEMTQEGKAAFTPELDATRGLANQVGDLISLLRTLNCVPFKTFEANDYAAFFNAFNLQDWHGQYKRLVTQLAENQASSEFALLPETPLTGGLLNPEPVPDEGLLIPQRDLGGVPPTSPAEMPEPMAETPLDLPPVVRDESEVEQAARDAWFWVEKGYVDRGLELFQIALEQYPNSIWLHDEYARASAQFDTKPALEAPKEVPVSAPVAPPQPTDEAKSYELMGDMAVNRGDYLFAKYSWDRVTEIDPNFPNIYRKLGLMTAEHLRDYRETAAAYLRKALETNPEDSDVQRALQQVSTDTPPPSNPPPTLPAELPPLEPAVQALPTTEENKSKGMLVLITGATSGIGKASAEVFAQHGHRLILTGRRVERLVALSKQLTTDFGTDILILPFDVRDSGAVEGALSKLPDAYQDIDILINNAGLAKGLAPIHEGDLNHWEAMIDTNIKGLLYVSRVVTKGMVKRRKGMVINVCSSAGRETYPNGNVYCATKFAVDALTKSMRFDLYEYNIRVGQVSPGHVEETEFALTRFDGDADRAKIYGDFQPLKSSDVADAIYFMATRPPHVNIQDVQMFASQQASSTVINRSGRNPQDI